MSNPFDYLKQQQEARARQRAESDDAVRQSREYLEKAVEFAARQWDAIVRRVLADLHAAAYAAPVRHCRVQYVAARAETDAHMLKRGNTFRRHSAWRLEERTSEFPEDWRALMQVRLRVTAKGKAEGFVCERFDGANRKPFEAGLKEKALLNALKKLYPPESVG